MNLFEKDSPRNLPLVTERPRPEKRAAKWQITITFAAAVTIVSIFLWGLNNQRNETNNQEPAASQPVPATPHDSGQQAAQPSPNTPQQQQNAGNSNPPSTTGSGSSHPPQRQNSAQ